MAAILSRPQWVKSYTLDPINMGLIFARVNQTISGSGDTTGINSTYRQVSNIRRTLLVN